MVRWKTVFVRRTVALFHSRMDYRLQYYNLKKERSQNSLSLEEIQVLLQINPILKYEVWNSNFVIAGSLASLPHLQEHGEQRSNQTHRSHRAHDHQVAANQRLLA